MNLWTTTEQHQENKSPWTLNKLSTIIQKLHKVVTIFITIHISIIMMIKGFLLNYSIYSIPINLNIHIYCCAWALESCLNFILKIKYKLFRSMTFTLAVIIFSLALFIQYMHSDNECEVFLDKKHYGFSDVCRLCLQVYVVFLACLFVLVVRENWSFTTISCLFVGLSCDKDLL